MGRRKREPMSEGKKNIIGILLEEYDIRSAKDIEDALKDLLGGTIQEMLESEMDEHLGYSAYERSNNTDYRNGKKTKKIRGNFGETEIEVPQDRDGTFEPKVPDSAKFTTLKPLRSNMITEFLPLFIMLCDFINWVKWNMTYKRGFYSI